MKTTSEHFPNAYEILNNPDGPVSDGRPPFPTRIAAPNMVYSVRLTDQRTVEEVGGSRSMVGATDRESLDIAVLDTLAYQQQRLTLFHEVLHVAFSIGIPQGWSIEGFKDDSAGLEEFIVDGLESPLAFILRSNPDLMAYLLWDGE